VNEVSTIEISSTEATAAAVADARCREAVGRLVDRLGQPGSNDPLLALFEETAAEARETGLTEAELVAYNVERQA
jgi:hypothetical protein